MNEGTMKNCFQRRPVVLGQEKQEQTTVPREVLWSECKKRKAGPQCSGQSCGPKARNARADHSALGKPVVRRQETQEQTTAIREVLWSQSKKRKAGPQCPGEACGPKARNARADHSDPGSPVVPKQETQEQTTVPWEILWSEGRKCQNPVKTLITKGEKIGPVKK